MTVSLNSALYNALGQLQGKNAMSALYQQNTGKAAQSGETDEVADRVELSSNLPKQLNASAFGLALSVGQKLSSGGELTDDEMAMLQSDRSFASTAALFAFQGATGRGLIDYMDGGSSSSKSSLSDLVAQYTGTWPTAESESPSATELADLVKRLSQRLSGADGVDSDTYSSLESERRSLLDLLRDGDYAALAEALAG